MVKTVTVVIQNLININYCIMAVMIIQDFHTCAIEDITLK